jgi:rhodanese-related sulfurtransferase
MSTPTINTITCLELYELHQRRSVELIDVRSAEEFGELRASMARNVPLDALNPVDLINCRRAASDEPLYFICQMGVRSEWACGKLIAAGFSNVVNVEGGTDAWHAAGLPVERNAAASSIFAQPAKDTSMKSTRVISIERQIKIVHGSIILASCLLGYFVSPWWYALAAAMGAGQIATGLTDRCGTRACLRIMPWNRDQPPAACGTNK